jgi:hypothetical protein
MNRRSPQHLPCARPALQELGEVLGVVAANPKNASLPVDYQAIPSPDVPDPPVPWALMDAPAISYRRAPNFNLLDVGVQN